MIVGYLKDAYELYGLSVPIRLEINTYPHMLITGASGSGKSFALLFLIGKLLQCYPEIIVYICDFKKSDDFAFLSDYPHYYAGKDCYSGIMEYYQSFSDARESGNNKTRYILIADEYPAFINYLQMQDKINKTKYANDILGAVSEVLMLGRGINFGIWIVTQRADSTLFANGARDNFMVVIALGRLSKEQKTMIFAGQEIPDSIMYKGEGLLLADGKELVAVKYPLISNIDNWKNHIIKILLKQN